MSRKLSDWLEGFHTLCMNLEAPEAFKTWSGIATISSALQRKVWVDFPDHHVKWYPALYIFLVSPPGGRKGTAIKPAGNLIRSLPPKSMNILANNITTERLLEKMAQDKIKTVWLDGEKYDHSSATCIATELTNLIKFKDPHILSNLTELWDCEDVYDKDTKVSGRDNLTNVFLTILSATTPDWLKLSLPAEAGGSGFTSRVVFVWSDKIERSISVTSKVKSIPKGLRIKLERDLYAIHSLRGGFKWTESVEMWYNDWYEKHIAQLGSSSSVFSSSFKDHWDSRKPSILWRVAMCLSASRGNNMKIHRRDLKRSLELLGGVERGFDYVFGGMGESERSRQIQEIVEKIRRNPGVSGKQLQSMLVTKVPKRECEDLLREAKDAGLVRYEDGSYYES